MDAAPPSPAPGSRAADPVRQEPVGPRLGELVDAFLGFDIKVLRTLRDLVFNPARVARAVVSGEEGYLGQVRLMIFLVSATTLLLVITNLYESMQVEALFAADPALTAKYAQALGASGHTIKDVNEAMRGWLNLLIAPVNLIYVGLYAALFKLLESRYTFFGHMLLSVVATNAATLASWAIVLAVMPFNPPQMLYIFVLSTTSLLYFLVIVWTFMTRTILGGVLKTLIVLVTLGVGTISTSIIMWVAVEQLATSRFGTGPITFMINQEIAEARQAP